MSTVRRTFRWEPRHGAARCVQCGGELAWLWTLEVTTGYSPYVQSRQEQYRCTRCGLVHVWRDSIGTEDAA